MCRSPVDRGCGNRANRTVLYEGDRIIWALEQDPTGTPYASMGSTYFGMKDVYIQRGWADIESNWNEWNDDPTPTYHLCLEMYGWNGDGWPIAPRWEMLSSVCMSKQYIYGGQGGEIPRLDISGFHEVNINAGWVNIDSEFGTIIDGEEAHTIFIPTVCK